jgi:hypothetical protein
MGCFCHAAAHLMAVAALTVSQKSNIIHVQCFSGCGNMHEYILVSQISASFIVIALDTVFTLSYFLYSKIYNNACSQSIWYRLSF